MKRADILNTANKIVNGERQEDYGSPEDNFTKIGVLWSTYLGVAITAEDVAAMMILLKTARISPGQTKIDNWVDIAGYAACGGEIQTRGIPEPNQGPELFDWNKEV